MSERLILDGPKAPRWISTEAGLRAWMVNEEWRRSAAVAMHVAERRRLLDEAEDLIRGALATA